MSSANSPTGAAVLDGRSYWLTRFLMLRLLGVVYLFAFLVAANQLLPLVGEHGLTPAAPYLERVREHFASEARTWLRYPTLFLLGCSDQAILAIAWTGVALAALCAAGYANAISMALLWAFYLSIAQIGQRFYSFGWENQILETGFLAIFLCPLLDACPFSRRPPPVAVLWLHRWLLFRILLGGGLIKMRGDPCWSELTAFDFYYETQPLPTPVARWFHLLPPGVHRLTCAATLFVELVVPWLLFWPQAARRAAGAVAILFQLFVALTGNHAFTNWLTIVACLACLDDDVWRRVLPRCLVERAERAATSASTSNASLVASSLLTVLVLWLSIDPVMNLLSPRQQMNASHDPLNLVNSYGSYGSVDRERYEIVFEGTLDDDPDDGAQWRAYEFKAKPGDPRCAPSWVSPYHHRIDWQLWFAAKETPDRHPWTLHFVWKLLHNDPPTLGLLAGNPFPERPPRYIRATLYRYQFDPTPGGAVWRRTYVDRWLPSLSVYSIELRRSLVECGWLSEKEARPK